MGGVGGEQVRLESGGFAVRVELMDEDTMLPVDSPFRKNTDYQKHDPALDKNV